MLLVGQLDDGRDDGQVLGVGLVSDVCNGGVLVEKLDGRLPVLGSPVVQAEVVGGGCLGIQVDEQDPRPRAAYMAARSTAVVVLPTPPL